MGFPYCRFNILIFQGIFSEFRGKKVSSGIGGVKFQGLRVFATVGEVYYAKWHYMKYCTQVIKYSLRRHTDPDSDAKEKNERTLKNCYQFLPFF